MTGQMACGSKSSTCKSEVRTWLGSFNVAFVSFPGLHSSFEPAQIWWQSASSASHSSRCQSMRLVTCQPNENPVKLVVWATCWEQAEAEAEACYGFPLKTCWSDTWSTPGPAVVMNGGAVRRQPASLGRFAHGWLTGWFSLKQQRVRNVSDACICIVSEGWRGEKQASVP